MEGSSAVTPWSLRLSLPSKWKAANAREKQKLGRRETGGRGADGRGVEVEDRDVPMSDCFSSTSTAGAVSLDCRCVCCAKRSRVGQGCWWPRERATASSSRRGKSRRYANC